MNVPASWQWTLCLYDTHLCTSSPREQPVVGARPYEVDVGGHVVGDVTAQAAPPLLYDGPAPDLAHRLHHAVRQPRGVLHDQAAKADVHRRRACKTILKVALRFRSVAIPAQCTTSRCLQRLGFRKMRTGTSIQVQDNPPGRTNPCRVHCWMVAWKTMKFVCQSVLFQLCCIQLSNTLLPPASMNVSKSSGGLYLTRSDSSTVENPTT